ncbi:MAG TPA: type II toxin-antitoxin system HicB family antitoxin [Candidatus Elarobacter sp.]|jgi:predicted RNase H-like HicB family nuclease|nr:type II toxin-antitoxin system HicB family antitoxin [Candidatus Elarobacter sp.]
MKYTIILEQADDGGWGAIAPDLPGILLMGDTREQIIAEAPEIIADWCDAMREDGHPIPEPGYFAVEVDVPFPEPVAQRQYG